MIQILIIHGFAVMIFTSILLKTRRTFRIMNTYDIEGAVCLEKEQLYAVELVDKRFIRMGFVPIRHNDPRPCMDNHPFAAYYAAEAQRQVMAGKEQRTANINLLRCTNALSFMVSISTVS
jgi:hypothetical protein